MRAPRRLPGVPAIQACCRAAARRHLEAVEIPPFTLFFHPTEERPWLNYAVPDAPSPGRLGGVLPRVEAAFHGRRRTPRFEYLDAYAPALAPALRAAGYADEGRPRVMTLGAGLLKAPRLPAGLSLRPVTRRSPAPLARRFLVLQRRVFGLGDPGGVTAAEADRFLDGLGEGRAFLASLDGEVVGTGMFTHPEEGLCEIVGVATLEPYRRRGIGAAVAHAAAAAAFARGAAAVFLSAGDGRAARVYAGLGFSDAGALAVLVRPATAVTGGAGEPPVNSPGGPPPKEGSA